MAELDDRIRQTEERLKQLKARKQQLEARKRAAESKKQRSDDTRRKILLGAAILAKVERGDWPKARMLEMMDQTLTRPADRALFGLDSKKEPAQETVQTIQPTSTIEEQDYRESV